MQLNAKELGIQRALTCGRTEFEVNFGGDLIPDKVKVVMLQLMSVQSVHGGK